MKMVWKKREREEGRKKRSRAMAADLDLPFDAAEEETAPAKEEEKKKGFDHVGTLDSDSRSSDPGLLAESFRSQGNQLAEVDMFLLILAAWLSILL